MFFHVAFNWYRIRIHAVFKRKRNREFRMVRLINAAFRKESPFNFKLGE